jgi:hypothetical protein
MKIRSIIFLFFSTIILSGCKPGSALEKDNSGPEIANEPKDRIDTAPGPTLRKIEPLLSSTVFEEYDPSLFTSGIFHFPDVDCPPEGSGTHSDPELNILKNRNISPAGFDTFTVGRIINNLPQNLPHAVHRAHWPGEALESADSFERKGAVVEGYLLGVKHEGPEACNCGSQTAKDFHLWLAAEPGYDKSTAIIVEISPRVSQVQPGWNSAALHRLMKQGNRVRISGWLMWDEEHDDQVGRTRATHWEIHPIHKIEWLAGNEWIEI